MRDLVDHCTASHQTYGFADLCSRHSDVCHNFNFFYPFSYLLNSVIGSDFGVRMPFKFWILGYAVLGWAMDLSLRPYLLKLIIDRLSFLKPIQAWSELTGA